MKKAKVLLLLPLFLAPAAHAGKVETIQQVLARQCDKKVRYEDALTLVRLLYLSCIPGTYVNVDEKCRVACLKPNSGAVIGR